MGKLIWHELSRYVSLAASTYAVWAGVWAIFFRKFFWDFVGGILRDPGGIQPNPRISVFITLIVRVPVIQTMTITFGLVIIALEWPLVTVDRIPFHRLIPIKILLLILQAAIAALLYQERPSPHIPYEAALSSGDLYFFQSETHLKEDIGIEFEIRVCPALQKKPEQRDGQILVSQEPSVATTGQPDPFAPPYSLNLHVGDLALDDEDHTAEYVVLLNKYCVVPHHFLLVTKEFRPQTSPLLPSDLVHIYQLLLAARRANKSLIAFYNCGINSGASQPHKHVQFIEVERDGPPLEKITRNLKIEASGRPFTFQSLPYANHIFRLPALSLDSTPAQLRETLFPPFYSLLDLVISTVRHDPAYPSGSPSYNVILTLEHMHLIPRRYETYTIPGTDTVIHVNSLGYAGMMLVKSHSDLEEIKKVGPAEILRGVGVESVHDLQVSGSLLETDYS
ncbi:ATP adenylyltransferase-domain-containing protein [Pisolithus croceorrhizus]|nr:ATP adenylyltransferase-domain-containing protein [Pisolithus croceorrhizus]